MLDCWCCRRASWVEIDSGGDTTSVESILRSKCVISRTDLVDFVENEEVSDLNIAETGHCDKITAGNEVGSTGDGSNSIVAWLRFQELEGF